MAVATLPRAAMRANDALYPLPGVSRHTRLSVAALLIFAVFLLDRTAGATLDNGSHFILLGTAIIGVAWLAGSVAALGATMVAAVLASFRVQAPGGASQIHLALFLLHAVLITADSAVISANYIETRPTATAVRIHADTDKVAIATNVTNGTLRINGAALAAKWNAINVAT